MPPKQTANFTHINYITVRLTTVRGFNVARYMQVMNVCEGHTLMYT